MRSWAMWRRMVVMGLGMVLLVCGGSLGVAARAATSDEIVAGPMIGSVTDKSARVWMQLSVAKDVTVTCYEVESGRPVSMVTGEPDSPLPFTCMIPAANLQPNKNYRIEVQLAGEPAKLPAPQLIIRTAPPVGSEAAFSVAIGSNLATSGPGAIHGKGTAPIFQEIETTSPRAFLLLGNIGTLPEKEESWPVGHRDAMRMLCDMHSKLRREPDLQPLLRVTPWYTVWNDRDYGTSGAGKAWGHQKESWAAFQRFWPNPQWGTPETTGCFYNFTIGDAEFFMLDSRMYRDADKDPARQTMLGEAQLKWLKDKLRESKATFKIIACGSQLLTDYGQGDTWANYQPEQKDFVKWIFDNDINGVIFASGGGVGEVTAIKQAGNHPKAYPLFEVTSGTLAGKASGKNVEAANPNRQGDVVAGNCFATLDFGGLREHRFLTLRLRSADGKVKAEQTLFAVQLKK